MPSIIVDGQGHSLYYEDTGIPPSPLDRPYTTIVAVHGTAFHGQTFKHLFALAPRHNIRLVVLNRRDYPGSSPYTEQDLQQIAIPENVEGHVEFVKARARELAQFIRRFIEKEDVPRASADYKSGGVVLLSWSSGNGYTLPLLAYADSIPHSTRQVIDPYLRSHIIFDAPRWILGKPPIGKHSDMIRGDSLPRDEFVRRFGEAVSAYYVHQSFTSRNIDDLQFVPTKDARPSTVHSMSADEIDETTRYDALFRSEIKAQVGEPKIYAERLRRALFDDELAGYWPNCRVDVIWCENSTWESVDVMWTLTSMQEQADRDGITGRPLRIVMFPGANHFPHWNEPGRAMKFFSDVADG